MADFTISGKMKVKTLKTNFKEEYGSTLRVYNGQKFADDDATLASLVDSGISDLRKLFVASPVDS